MFAIPLAAMGTYYGKVTYKLPRWDYRWELSAYARLGHAPILSMVVGIM